jgi:signal transduction histidine kinase
VTSRLLAEASRRGDAVTRIAREDAPAFGLPARTALAGLAPIHAAGTDGLVIVAVASAERERDRERWASRRSILSVVLAAGLVLAFGGRAVRKQRAELTLAHRLTIADLVQQRDERLQRASKAAALGTLAMGVAHEISTPLGVIALRAEQIAARAAQDERIAGAAAVILEQTERVRQIMRGLLGLARGDAPIADRVDPTALVTQAIGLVEHRFTKADVRLEPKLEAALPEVLGDPRLLEHAVVNLLLNACDASPAGGTVTVSALRDGDGVAIRVDDEGSGISPSDVDRVTEPFFTTKSREEGTGLGLAIAKEIVSSHRGTLTLAPRPPRGTRAAIALPAALEKRDV